ncbi:pyrophosphatase PpaX [Cohnella sp. LGH]|uniref:pyrophosphatase PpaX n=1 Tax=Cohnella sp. LGH TaxID=1619153 RepID=UPI001ADA8EC4|nr:pyrophosphatase PpaX [Cohnella sp. LGH]QTH42115.1 pyrophosphatase PpaX [Cohnella sp. LGH]
MTQTRTTPTTQTEETASAARKPQAKITTVLFDLDGTIIDTNELIIQSFMHALIGHVPASFGREHIIPSMGEPLSVQMKHFTGREDVATLVGAYRDYNLLKHDEMVSLFPGVKETIEQLHRQGIRLGVVTTKMRETTLRALKLLEIYSYMDTIVTLDDVDNAKPHPEPVAKAVAALGAEASKTLMVGDSSVDIVSALRAGAVPVGVAWSLKGEELLRSSGASYIIKEMDELLTLCGIGNEGA